MALKPASKESERFRRAQWRMLGAAMFCYLFYYTGRQNFGFASKALSDELGLTATQVGWIGSAVLICYGIGQAINGNLGDRFGARRLMTLGALLSVCFNWWTSFATSFWALIIPWGINGYVQALGWAPGSRLLSNWWARHERGRAFGFYVFAAGFSSIFTFAVSLIVLDHFGWRWIFRLPVLFLLVGGVVFYFVARDRPEDLGLAPLTPEEDSEGDNASETSAQRYRAILRSPRFLVACLSIGCESIARYGLLFWVPYHYLGDQWKSNPGAAWISLALPIGMALGALTAGHVSDRFFRSNRSRPIAVFLALAAFVSLVIYAVPAEQRTIGMILLFLAGFFVYGPQSSFWALCPDLLGRSRAGTGVGIMNAFAYGSAAAGEVFIGRMIDLTGNTETVFLVVASVCLVGSALILAVKR